MVAFFGEEFEPAPKVSYRRLLRLYSAAASQNEQAAGAALDRLLDALLQPADIARFDDVCDKNFADSDALWKFSAEMFGAMAERPTVQPSDSSDGPSSTPVSSVSSAVDRATDRYVGRPDIQAGILRSVKSA